MPLGASPAAFFIAASACVQLGANNGKALSDRAYLLMWGASPSSIAQICYNWTMHKGCENDCFHK